MKYECTYIYIILHTYAKKLLYLCFSGQYFDIMQQNNFLQGTQIFEF